MPIPSCVESLLPTFLTPRATLPLRLASLVAEYALDAVKAAKDNIKYISSVPLNVKLPMIWRDDLIEGLFRLTLAPDSELNEPENGYAIAGLSFTAAQLFSAIKSRIPSFSYSAENVRGPAAAFARLWPDSLSSHEAERDLKLKATFRNLEDVVDLLLENSPKIKTEL